MKEKFSLKSIFGRFKTRMSLTFLLLLLENIFRVAQPFVLGLAINDLIGGSFTGLWYFCALYASGFVIGVLRRYYDTRVYTSIYAKIASEMVEHQNKQEDSVSAVTARSSLIKELVDFFEVDLTQAITAVIGIVGAIVMLAFFDWRLFAACAAAMIIIFAIYYLSEGKIYGYNKNLNDELEHRVAIFEKRKRPLVARHFHNVRKWMVKLSDLETLNFGIIEIILFTLVMFALFVAASGEQVTPGGVFAILSYVMEFAEGVWMLPLLFQQFVRLKEISQRLGEVSE